MENLSKSKKSACQNAFFEHDPALQNLTFKKNEIPYRKKIKKNTTLKIDWFLLCLNGLFRGIVRRVPESAYRFFLSLGGFLLDSLLYGFGKIYNTEYTNEPKSGRRIGLSGN